MTTSTEGAGYDRILELDLDVVAVDGSLHKAPCGEGTGPSPVDRYKLGWKCSVASDCRGALDSAPHAGQHAP